MRSRVDLPQPELPSSANSSPFFTVRLTPFDRDGLAELLHDIDDLDEVVRLASPRKPGCGLPELGAACTALDCSLMIACSTPAVFACAARDCIIMLRCSLLARYSSPGDEQSPR